jgi:hypothetical protein
VGRKEWKRYIWCVIMERQEYSMPERDRDRDRTAQDIRAIEGLLHVLQYQQDKNTEFIDYNYMLNYAFSCVLCNKSVA